MTISKQLVIVGLVSIAILNPLSVNVIADVLITAINTGMEYLVRGSGYIMAVSATLIGVGGLLMYNEYKQAHVAKLKKLKHTKTSRAGEFLEA
jgi:hypothetical protein